MISGGLQVKTRIICHIGSRKLDTKRIVSPVFCHFLSRIILIPRLDVGKFLNGYSQVNYHIPPKGWNHVDALVSFLLFAFDIM